MANIKYMKTSGYKNDAEKAVSEEKRRIFEGIKAYRQKHGVGCFKQISAATGGKVKIHTISHMVSATKVDDEIWKQVGEALEKLREGK